MNHKSTNINITHNSLQHNSNALYMGMFLHTASPGEKAVLARGRGVSIVRVALLTAERLPALAVPFVGGRDIDVALAQPLARTQARAGLPEQARVILKGERRLCNVP